MTIEQASDELFFLICSHTNKTNSVGVGDNCIHVCVEYGNRKIIEQLLDKNGKFKGFDVKITEVGKIVPHEK